MLIRLGIRNSVHSQIHNEINWTELDKLAAKQGLSAMIMDGIEKLPEEERPQRNFCYNGLERRCKGMSAAMNYIVKRLLKLQVSLMVMD